MFRPPTFSAASAPWRRLTSSSILSAHSVFHRLPPHQFLFTRLPVRSSPSSTSATVALRLRHRGRRFLTFLLIIGSSAYLGGMMALGQHQTAIKAWANMPSDAETLEMYEPPNELAREINEHIKNHHLAVHLRNEPNIEESRPHLKIRSPFREQNLMAGTLAGDGMIAVPPLHFAEKGGKSSVSIFYLGSDICGHPGIVHGGLLATILDEGLARCCFPALPKKMAVTANLNVNYRKPAPADNYFVLRANTTKIQGRKAWVEGRIESLTVNGEEPIVYTEATALFIEPKDDLIALNIFQREGKVPEPVQRGAPELRPSS